MSTPLKRRGRPTRAAESLDAALAAEYAGLSPSRPRNEFEQQAMKKSRGRKPNPQGKTQQAADYAVYLVNTESCSIASAASRAALAFKVNADNIRRYAARQLKGPQVQVPGKNTWAGKLPPTVEPLLIGIADVEFLT